MIQHRNLPRSLRIVSFNNLDSLIYYLFRISLAVLSVQALDQMKNCKFHLSSSYLKIKSGNILTVAISDQIFILNHMEHFVCVMP